MPVWGQPPKLTLSEAEGAVQSTEARSFSPASPLKWVARPSRSFFLCEGRELEMLAQTSPRTDPANPRSCRTIKRKPLISQKQIPSLQVYFRGRLDILESTHPFYCALHTGSRINNSRRGPEPPLHASAATPANYKSEDQL
jgi:hypothetical protein